MKTKSRICSQRGCKKKLRSNSKGDTCYDHRQQAVNKPTRKLVSKKLEKTKKKSTKPGKGTLHSVDILLIIVNPTHQDCEMKFVFLKTANVDIRKFFKALTHVKGSTNSIMTMAGLTEVSAPRPLTLSDINHALKKFIPKINQFFPDVTDSGLKEPPQIYEIGDRGFKKSEMRILP